MRSSITKRLALIVVSVAATLFGLIMLSAPAQAAGVNSAKVTGDITYLTNKQRALHGCKPLHVDARLNVSAAGHSADMAETGGFSHIGSNGSDFVTRGKLAHYPAPSAENVAFGFRTGLDVVKAWMASPEHRANILNCASKTVGVAVAVNAAGTPYYTQDFGY